MPIPARLIRTLGETIEDGLERNWVTSVSLTPEWEHVTYRDPIDPADFPLTSPHWSKCGSGAQLGGLVRLEALYHNGGVYIDSDYVLWHPLDSLLVLDAFAAWEDGTVVPDAVLGFSAKHPALLPMIHEAIERLPDGAWESGPGVTTRNLQGRDDVLLLPPQSFYPMHYRKKSYYEGPRGRERIDLLKNASPYSFGIHLWNASWL